LSRKRSFDNALFYPGEKTSPKRACRRLKDIEKKVNTGTGSTKKSLKLHVVKDRNVSVNSNEQNDKHQEILPKMTRNVVELLHDDMYSRKGSRKSTKFDSSKEKEFCECNQKTAFGPVEKCREKRSQKLFGDGTSSFCALVGIIPCDKVKIPRKSNDAEDDERHTYEKYRKNTLAENNYQKYQELKETAPFGPRKTDDKDGSKRAPCGSTGKLGKSKEGNINYRSQHNNYERSLQDKCLAEERCPRGFHRSRNSSTGVESSSGVHRLESRNSSPGAEFPSSGFHRLENRRSSPRTETSSRGFHILEKRSSSPRAETSPEGFHKLEIRNSSPGAESSYRTSRPTTDNYTNLGEDNSMSSLKLSATKINRLKYFKGSTEKQREKTGRKSTKTPGSFDNGVCLNKTFNLEDKHRVPAGLDLSCPPGKCRKHLCLDCGNFPSKELPDLSLSSVKCFNGY
jgi:hypothetical protein